MAPWFPQKSATGLRRKSLATLETRELRDLGGQQLGILFFSGNMADIWQISMDFLNHDLYYMCIVFLFTCLSSFFVFWVFFLIPVFVWFSFFWVKCFLSWKKLCQVDDSLWSPGDQAPKGQQEAGRNGRTGRNDSNEELNIWSQELHFFPNSFKSV